MGNNSKIILIDTGSESNQIMMSDIGKLPNAVQISDVYKFRNKIDNFLFRLHFGFKLNKYFDVPFKFIWDRKNVLNQLLIEDGCEYYLILTNDVIRKFSVRYLRKLNQMKDVHVYVVLLDSYDYLQPYFRRCVNRVQSDHVYSFQKSDCKKHGFHYVNTLYSCVDLSEYKTGVSSDVYFVGADKNRMKEVYNVYSRLSLMGFHCRFVVIIKPKNLVEYELKYKGIEFRTKRIGYKEILSDISSTKCILELCQQGQDGLTMRFYEALFYNKYLLTNNLSARNHPFFNSNYMMIFNDTEEIVSFFKDDNIDYQYRGEMSPTLLVDHILNRRDKITGYLK